MPTNAPAIDIDALSPRELDAAVAEVVMRWKRETRPDGWTMPNYYWSNSANHWSTDANRAREVEAEIERRGLVPEYIIALSRLFNFGDVYSWTDARMDVLTARLFLFATATPAQRCRAALKAVMGS